jgi:hypothetical protein
MWGPPERTGKHPKLAEMEKNARDVDNAGGVNALAYSTGDPIGYATRRIIEMTLPTNARSNDVGAVQWRFSEYDSAAANDRAITAKQSAVSGDLCPIGGPATVPSAENPTCSIWR